MRSYSPSTGGFYDAALHGENVPADAVPITAKKHAALLAAQAAGASIVPDKQGRPVARHSVAGPAAQRERVGRLVRREARRRILAVASLELQSNDNALLALAALQFSTLGASELDIAPAAERRSRIDAIRAASNALELELVALGAADLSKLDAAAVAAAWPMNEDAR